jgi:hypothetical protein
MQLAAGQTRAKRLQMAPKLKACENVCKTTITFTSISEFFAPRDKPQRAETPRRRLDRLPLCNVLDVFFFLALHDVCGLMAA